MAATFHLSILTPERGVFEGEVEYLEAPGSEGYFGVLANHASMVTSLMAGRLTLRQGGRDETYQVSGGFFEVSKNRATVLADTITGDRTT